MTTKAATKTTKVVHILGRAQFKANGYILYRVQAEVDGVRHEKHDVTVVDGKITSCSDCKSWQFNRKCCHTDEVQKREDARKVATVQLAADELVCTDPFVVHGGNVVERLSRSDFCDEFGIYE